MSHSEHWNETYWMWLLGKRHCLAQRVVQRWTWRWLQMQMARMPVHMLCLSGDDSDFSGVSSLWIFLDALDRVWFIIWLQLVL